MPPESVGPGSAVHHGACPRASGAKRPRDPRVLHRARDTAVVDAAPANQVVIASECEAISAASWAEIASSPSAPRNDTLNAKASRHLSRMRCGASAASAALLIRDPPACADLYNIPRGALPEPVGPGSAAHHPRARSAARGCCTAPRTSRELGLGAAGATPPRPTSRARPPGDARRHHGRAQQGEWPDVVRRQGQDEQEPDQAGDHRPHFPMQSPHAGIVTASPSRQRRDRVAQGRCRPGSFIPVCPRASRRRSLGRVSRRAGPRRR